MSTLDLGIRGPDRPVTTVSQTRRGDSTTSLHRPESLYVSCLSDPVDSSETGRVGTLELVQ